MAQSKFTEMAGKFGKSGGPPGLTAGLKVLAAVGAVAYGASQSLYTGLSYNYQILCYFIKIIKANAQWIRGT